MPGTGHKSGRAVGRSLTFVVGLLVALGLAWAPAAPVAGAQSADPVIAAAGDIACDPSSSSFNNGNGTSQSCRQKATAALLTPGLAAVLPLGDNQYYCGGLSAFQASYDASWGAAKAITHPVVGNHEYLTSGGTGCDASNAGAAGYFTYFGAAAGASGAGYYSYDIGSWHLIALNSNCGNAGGCSATSPQGKWLAADLASHPAACTLAYWHIPLFSSGGRSASNSKSFWDQLYAAGVDLILNGHDHIYERFARQTSAGVADPVSGIREFVVGTGGANHTSIASIAANSEVRNASTYGVLRLTLHAGSYDWQFAPEAGATFTDSGSEACHGAPGSQDLTPPTTPTGLTATGSGTDRISLAWTASTDNVGVAGYSVTRDGQAIANIAAALQSYLDTGLLPGTTHTYTVQAFDAAGNRSGQSLPASGTTLTGSQDLTPPTTPTGLTATGTGTDRISLAWTASTDNVGVAGYTVTRDGQAIADVAPAPQSYLDTGLSPGTTHTYTVQAFDAAGNRSGQSLPASGTTLTGSPQVVNLAPNADSFVGADKPTTNNGKSTALRQDGSPILRTYIRFDLSSISGTITRATLRLLPNANQSGGIQAHHGTVDTWTETGITWQNAPPFDATVVASSGSLVSGTWISMDVTAAVSGTTLTLVLTTNSPTQTNLSSRETANPPVLVVEFQP